MKLRLKRDIVIPAGTELVTSPRTREYGVPHVEALMGLSPDVTATFTFFPDDLTDEEKDALIYSDED